MRRQLALVQISLGRSLAVITDMRTARRSLESPLYRILLSRRTSRYLTCNSFLLLCFLARMHSISYLINIPCWHT